jgi:hypothetical protein
MSERDGTPQPQDRDAYPEEAVRIFVRPLASPLPIGSIAFTLGLVVLSAVDRTVLPIGRRGADRSWLERDLSERIGTVSREAGVRRPL